MVPGVLLLLARLEVVGAATALRIATIVYLVTLVVIGRVAVRRSRLTPWQQVLAMGLLVVLGGAVVGLQTLAHAA